MEYRRGHESCACDLYRSCVGVSRSRLVYIVVQLLASRVSGYLFCAKGSCSMVPECCTMRSTNVAQLEPLHIALET